MNWRWTKALGASALALACSGAVGCASERAPIVRVQADALAKSFFIGEDLVDKTDNPQFYANGTLLDIGYGAAQDGLFSAFYSNDLSIIRWEVTEDFLLGRLAFERIDGTDGKGTGAETNDGQVLYVFNIKKHFDIQNAYNPSTGEELNVVEENTTDRPWYQRKYFRVDWSQNLNTDGYDFDTMAVYGVLFGLTWEPIAYYVNDPNHPHSPNFETNDGYFDITTKAYAAPEMIDISHISWAAGWSSVPACFFDGDVAGGAGVGSNCNPQEVTIRHSFWKKPESDYEPTDWDGFMFQAAGPFLKERMGYARNYGLSDSRWRRFVSRYNIWEQSHTDVECFTPETTGVGEEPTRDLDLNGTHDECQDLNGNNAVTNAGAKCDHFNQKCTIPYRERDTKPVVMYYTVDSDQRFFEPTVVSAQEWDVAMRIAVLAAKNAECNKVAGLVDGSGIPVNCDYAYPVPHGQMDQMVDLVNVIQEADVCMQGNGEWDVAPCEDVVRNELQERGYDLSLSQTPEGDDYWTSPEGLGMFTAAMMDHMVVLCHSPIEAGDHPACAPGKARLPAEISALSCDLNRQEGGDASIREACNQAYNVRIGDVRYHLVNVIKSPETPSPWGFGPTYSDPLTGEAISGSINVWSNPTDRIAQLTIDNARFIAGELSVEQVTDGTYVKDWADAAVLAGAQGAHPGMHKDMRLKRLNQSIMAAGRDLETGHDSHDHHSQLRDMTRELIPQEVMNDVQHGLKELKNTTADIYAQSVFAPTYRARREAVKDTETEAALINPAMLQYAGATTLPTEIAVPMASPIRGSFNPTISRSSRHLREMALAQRGACMLEADHFAPSPTAMLSLTKVLQEKFGAFDPSDSVADQLARAETMKRWLAARLHTSVMIHEMGHTFGLRHNFVSSSSAFNYRPQYWQLRTRNGQITQECADLTNTEQEAADCIGPRYHDQITQEETDQGIWTWMHSSTMDYAGDYTQDMLGLGAYDYHATRMFYGGTAAVFQHSDFNDGGTLSAAITDSIMDNFGGIVGYQYQTAPGNGQSSNTIHYSKLQQTYRLIENCRAIPDIEAYKPSNWNEERDGVWSPLMDGLIVQVDGQYSRCDQQKIAYVPWDDLRFPGVSGFYRGGPAIDKVNRTRFPYAFATDRWADLGNLSVYRHDNGADPYELFNFFIAEQEVRHIFDNYRRERTGFSVRSAANRILGRYNEKMRDGAKGMSLINNNIKQIAAENNLDPVAFFAAVVDYWGWGDNMLASGMAFDHFARQMQRPQAGPHIDPGGIGTTADTVLTFDENEANPALIVPDGAQGFWNTVGIGGKRVENDLADGFGEYDVQYTINAGSYYDKAHAPMLFTESVDNFVSSSPDDFTDARDRAVSIADLFPDGYRRWLAHNLTEDDFLKAPRISAVGITPDVQSDMYPAMPIGWTSWWTQSPELCFPAAGTTVCSAYERDGSTFEALMPAATRPIAPQVSWEQQKLLIVKTLEYLPENAKQLWLDMIGIWEVGADSDPGFLNRIEFHHPSGDIYVARTYGTEEICFEQCKTVQRGIGARILEYANELLQQSYQTTEVIQGDTTWYVPVLDVNGQPIVNGGGTCEARPSCVAMNDYVSVPNFIRTALRDFRMADVTMKGIYE